MNGRDEWNYLFWQGINGLTSLHESIKTHTPKLAGVLKSDKPLRATICAEERKARGRQFFSDIYAGHTERVLEAMSVTSGGDLSYYAVTSVYGDLMAEMRILGAAETVLLEFVCCLADNVAPQAKG